MYRRKLLLILAVLFCLSLPGCSADQNIAVSPTESIPCTTAPDGPLLSIHTETAYETVRISPEELGGHLERGILYEGVANVTIDIDGTSFKLEDAIRDGFITPAQLFAYPILDAENGFCAESTRVGRTGLTAFVYTYPDAEVWIVYDVWKTPDGQQHLIQDFRIFRPGGSKSESPGSYLDLETYTRLDREDWGIDFAVSAVSPTGITLTCDHTGGQHIGQLHIMEYLLDTAIDFVPRLETADDSPRPPISVIQENTCSEIVIDWTDVYGALPAGTYCIRLYIHDIYDESDVHPLMMNYTDAQAYNILFSIP